MKKQENSVSKKEIDNLKVSQNEASQRKKGISMQLQKELKQNAHLIDNNNNLQKQLKQQEATFQQERDNWSRERVVALARSEEIDILKQRAQQYDTLRLEYDTHVNHFHRLNVKYKEQSEAATMFHKDWEAEKAKVSSLEDKLRAKRMKTPTCHNEISMAGDYQPIEVENLQEEVRQLVIVNDDLSTKLEEEVSKSNKLRAKLWEWEAKQPPSFSLYRSYELQRDLLFLLHDYKLGQELNEDEFVLLWLLAKNLKKDLKLQKFTGALITMGDLGTRNFVVLQGAGAAG
jgi:hypothetical protein